MKRTASDYVKDIFESMQKARAFVEAMDYGAFVNDDKTNFATVKALEIIGEATKQLPEDILARFPEVPWSDMAKMRDKVIHAYFGIDLRIVWDTVTTDIPDVAPTVRRCLEALEAEEGEG